ncbi:MAG: diguanylate cyclase [Gammaproteobacteria bacterium]|nr:diguanylate cyclase [Gammaproteobacteria bacterium]
MSIGLTEAAESDDLDCLLQRADAAMYDAKDQGRNRVAIRKP